MVLISVQNFSEFSLSFIKKLKVKWKLNRFQKTKMHRNFEMLLSSSYQLLLELRVE